MWSLPINLVTPRNVTDVLLLLVFFVPVTVTMQVAISFVVQYGHVGFTSQAWSEHGEPSASMQWTRPGRKAPKMLELHTYFVSPQNFQCIKLHFQKRTKFTFPLFCNSHLPLRVERSRKMSVQRPCMMYKVFNLSMLIISIVLITCMKWCNQLLSAFLFAWLEYEKTTLH